jgi:hypothetical protein
MTRPTSGSRRVTRTTDHFSSNARPVALGGHCCFCAEALQVNFLSQNLLLILPSIGLALAVVVLLLLRREGPSGADHQSTHPEAHPASSAAADGHGPGGWGCC